MVANVSSAMVLQNLSSVSHPSPKSLRGPFRSIPHYALNDGKVPKKNDPSRRGTLTVFLQVALFCSPSAQAASTGGSIHNASGFERMPLEKSLVMHGSNDMRSTLGLSSRSYFRKKGGVVLAYHGQQTSSDSSLGLLGCLIFGLLFLKGRLTRTGSETSLEDVQQRLKKVDKELCLQTRNSVTSKLGASQLADNNIGKDGGSNEVLLRKLVNARSNLIEVGEQLDKSRGMSESLKEHVSSLEASIREMKRGCGLLGEKIDEQLKVRDGLEEILWSMETDLDLKADKVGSLRACLGIQEEAYHASSKELVLVESSLGRAIDTADQAKNKLNNMNIALFSGHGLEESLAEELKAAMARNEALEKEKNGAAESMREESASASASLRELKEHLEIKGRESVALSVELMKKRDELHSYKEVVSQLMSDRGKLRKVLKEKQSQVDGLLELSNSAGKSITMSKNELTDLHGCVRDERSRSMALEREQDLALAQLVMVSSELENQITREKELIAKLESELCDDRMAWASANVEVSALQKSMEAISASQAHLQEQLGGLHEAKQAHMVALRKEKRAAAYAKKKLATCEEILAEEKGVLQRIRVDLEQESAHIQDLKVEVSARTAELEKAMDISAHLADDDVTLKADKQAVQKGSEQGNKVLTPVGGRSCRQSRSKQTKPKVGKNP